MIFRSGKREISKRKEKNLISAVGQAENRLSGSGLNGSLWKLGSSSGGAALTKSVRTKAADLNAPQ